MTDERRTFMGPRRYPDGNRWRDYYDNVVVPLTVKVFDPDGEVIEMDITEATYLVEHRDAVRCEPDEYGGFLHFHLLYRE